MRTHTQDLPEHAPTGDIASLAEAKATGTNNALSLFLNTNGMSSQSEEKPHEGDLSVGDSSTINKYELGLLGPRTVQVEEGS